MTRYISTMLRRVIIHQNKTFLGKLRIQNIYYTALRKLWHYTSLETFIQSYFLYILIHKIFTYFKFYNNKYKVVSYILKKIYEYEIKNKCI